MRIQVPLIKKEKTLQIYVARFLLTRKGFV